VRAPGSSLNEIRLTVNRQEIQSLFEPQIEGIVKRITEQLDWLKDNGLPQQVVGTR
jgi:hypothetical protein